MRDPRFGPILSWCDLELRAAGRHRKPFAPVFGKKLAISHRYVEGD
ncbi:MAG: hypothetical protein LUQ49_03250 [Methanomicrobiales archaeon]|nr:hypothetical protein [Methanomicrobiales archaeon]